MFVAFIVSVAIIAIVIIVAIVTIVAFVAFVALYGDGIVHLYIRLISNTNNTRAFRIYYTLLYYGIMLFLLVFETVYIF